MSLKMKIMMALLATSSRALRPTGTRMMKVTKGSRMLQREGKWTPTSALLDSACSLDCPACGGDGCGVCGGGLLGAQKPPVSLEVPVHASTSYCGCGGLGCEMCGGGMLLAAAPKTRAAVHA